MFSCCTERVVLVDVTFVHAKWGTILILKLIQ
ncbi:hypothetical protein VPHK479_0062 [Vibrio phage K479]